MKKKKTVTAFRKNCKVTYIRFQNHNITVIFTSVEGEIRNGQAGLL